MVKFYDVGQKYHKNRTYPIYPVNKNIEIFQHWLLLSSKFGKCFWINHIFSGENKLCIIKQSCTLLIFEIKTSDEYVTKAIGLETTEFQITRFAI